MRWSVSKPEEGSEKIVTNKFLWFPLYMKGEIRWLERASFKMVCERDYEGSLNWYYLKWLD